MRVQISGLALLVQEQMKLSPFELGLFVFCNRQRRILKALYCDRTGFCLSMKRLEVIGFRGRGTPKRRVIRSTPGSQTAAERDRFLGCTRGDPVQERGATLVA